MKRTVELKEDSSSTTTEITNKLQIIENNHFFNSVDKLAADHDVYVSNTMIKVTYKKALKDQNTTDNAVDARGEPVFTKSMNYSELNKKKKYIKTMNLCSSDISLISNSPKVHIEGSKAFAYHSTSKSQKLATEKKKYVNGLHSSSVKSASVKLNNVKEKNSAAEVQKGFSSQEDGSLGSKKSKTIQTEATIKPKVSKRFLKGNNSLIKPKASIQKNSVEIKKMALCNVATKNLKELESSKKKKVEINKELKRKASNKDLNVLAKKIKVSENKIKQLEGNGKFDDRYKFGGGKRPIMLVDPDLPTGWTRCIRTKNKGSANEQYIVYVVNPQGKKFRFKWKLRKYLERTNSSLDVDRFFFGLYQRPKPMNVSALERPEETKNNKVLVSECKALDCSGSKNYKSSSQRNAKQDEGSNNDSGKSSDGKELLLYDPNLPFGWKRIIHSNISSGKKQVHIISPDGKIFRRRYKLNEYLIKHQYTYKLDRFYFGLYAKKEGTASESSGRESANSMKSNKHTTNNKLVKKGTYKRVKNNSNYGSLLENRQLRLIFRKIDHCGAYKDQDFLKMDECAILNSEVENDSSEFKDVSKLGTSNIPMYDDPNLPEGWKRFIKIRSCGESAGRMEVVIVSPDGRKHRSKKHLEHYLLQKELGFKAEDFDFHVFGKSNLKKRFDPAQEPEPEPEPGLEADSQPNDLTFLSMKKKFTDKPVPELDIDSLKDIMISPEGQMINEVNGLMMSCGLTSTRNERRQRLPRGEHEKQLKSHLSSEGDVSCKGCEIPAHWIQRLVKCRGDFRTLEADAASTVGEAAKDFIKTISFLAFSISKHSDRGLRYEDVAELVHGTKSLSPLQTLIPKKITYKEYIKLNRPKQFLSFT